MGHGDTAAAPQPGDDALRGTGGRRRAGRRRRRRRFPGSRARSARPGSGAVIVPSTSAPGFAAACVAVSLLRQPGRPALAVIDLAQAEATATVADAAAMLGVRIPVEAWDPDGDRLDADAHRERLRRLVLGLHPAGNGLCTLADRPVPAVGDDRPWPDRSWRSDLRRTFHDGVSTVGAGDHPASRERSSNFMTLPVGFSAGASPRMRTGAGP